MVVWCRERGLCGEGEIAIVPFVVATGERGGLGGFHEGRPQRRLSKKYIQNVYKQHTNGSKNLLTEGEEEKKPKKYPWTFYMESTYGTFGRRGFWRMAAC